MKRGRALLNICRLPVSENGPIMVAILLLPMLVLDLSPSKAPGRQRRRTSPYLFSVVPRHSAMVFRITRQSPLFCRKIWPKYLLKRCRYTISAEERILFEQILSDRYIPDAAIFIDGSNEFYFDDPLFTSRLRQAMEDTYDFDADIAKLPVVRLAKKTGGHAFTSIKGMFGMNRRQETTGFDNTQRNSPEMIQYIMARYLANRKLITSAAHAFGVKCIFVWQPVPTFKYDERYHPFGDEGHIFSRHGYSAMEKDMRSSRQDKNFLWCADIQEHVKEQLYVDGVHYSAKLTALLSQCIARGIQERSLLQ